MRFAKLAAMIGALGCATAGVGLVASGVGAAALIILAATIVAAIASEERDSVEGLVGHHRPAGRLTRWVPQTR